MKLALVDYFRKPENLAQLWDCHGFIARGDSRTIGKQLKPL